MSAPNENYISDQSQRLLEVVEALAGNEFGGVSVAEIAAATRQRSDQVVRSLANLVKANWAEKMANGRYRLAEKPVQIGLSFSSALARAETDLAGIRGRYIKQF